MRRIIVMLAGMVALTVSALATADSYSDTVDLFKNAGQSASFFKSSYGYAVFPTIGKGGLVVGGAHGLSLIHI